MTRERLYLYDTTLRDGQQTQGVQFSTTEKQQIARALDALGVDYIEGGWPGANPTDSEFFAHPPQTQARFTAFGMTKRAGRSVEMMMFSLRWSMRVRNRSVWLVRPMISTWKKRWEYRLRRT